MEKIHCQKIKIQKDRIRFGPLQSIFDYFITYCVFTSCLPVTELVSSIVNVDFAVSVVK